MGKVISSVRGICRKSRLVRNVLGFFWGGVLPYSVKLGRKYVGYKKLLDESQWWTKEQLDGYQLKKMKETLVLAYEHVPYYREKFLSIGFDPHMMEHTEDIECLGFTDKDEVMKHFDSFLNEEVDVSKLEVATTGGTSGKQLRLYSSFTFRDTREMPFVDLIWSRVGFDRKKSKMAVLRNNVLPEGKLWLYDQAVHALLLDSYHLTDENIEKILNVIRKKKIEYLHTYPSAALILCDFIKLRRIKFESSLKAALVTSENLYPGQKEEIEKYLSCRCFTFYGHTEAAAIAGWCECSDKYHVQPEYGYVELIDEGGRVITEPGIEGEIVCTGFDNPVMPLIRYRTGDYSSWAQDQVCPCGRHYRLMNEIQGRWTQEFFVGRYGNKISMTALNMHSDIFRNVRNYQFRQDEVGKCILLIVKSEGYSEGSDEANILSELKKKFADSIDVHIQYVDAIERTLRGKQRFIIQNLNVDEVGRGRDDE